MFVSEIGHLSYIYWLNIFIFVCELPFYKLYRSELLSLGSQRSWFLIWHFLCVLNACYYQDKAQGTLRATDLKPQADRRMWKERSRARRKMGKEWRPGSVTGYMHVHTSTHFTFIISPWSIPGLPDSIPLFASPKDPPATQGLRDHRGLGSILSNIHTHITENADKQFKMHLYL